MEGARIHEEPLLESAPALTPERDKITRDSAGHYARARNW